MTYQANCESDSHQTGKMNIMRKVPSVGIVLLAFLLGTISCTATTEPTQDSPASVNLVNRGNVSASVEEESIQQAFDGDLETMWVAKSPAPTWVVIEFEEFRTVDRIELIISQNQPGPTTHEIWYGDDTYTSTLYRRLANVQTEDGHTLEVIVDPPHEVNKVYILTTQSHGWAAWREIRIWGLEDAIEPRHQEAEWQLQEVASGLEMPIQITHAGDGSGRLFVVEKVGRIRLIKNGTINKTPFLDITHRVLSVAAEQGFFNLVFPPNHAMSKSGESPAGTHRQHFYASYTNLDGDTVISRFTMTGDPDQADPDSEEIFLVIDQPERSHNGGTIAFGPNDGYLYIGSGDGGGTIPEVLAQDAGNLLSKILRIDVESDVKPYGIPPDNPFATSPGMYPEIWAQGLRNPWGFAFDSQTGDLYISDVGQSSREEVNFQSADSPGGEHYGWPIWEGNFCHEVLSVNCANDGFVLPVTNYDHSQGCAIAGGVVRNSVFYYADFCRGRIWALQRQGEGWKNRLLIEDSVPISSIGTNEQGDLYAVGHLDGIIYALIPPAEKSE